MNSAHDLKITTRLEDELGYCLKMFFEIIVIALTATIIFKKTRKRYRTIGSQTPLTALTSLAEAGSQTNQQDLYESDSSEVGMHLVNTYFGFASDDDSSNSFFSTCLANDSVLEYSDNDQQTLIQTLS